MSATNQEPVRPLGRGALLTALLGAFLVTSLHGSQALAAGSNSTVQGDYVAALGPLHLVLHVAAAPGAGLSGTLDSPDQGAAGIPCEDFKIAGNIVRPYHGTC
jgi:hypothetical protein